MTKTAPETVLVGDTVAIAITALNHGPGAATGVEVTDVLPAGFTYVSDAPTQGVYDAGTGVWTVGALALDGQAQLVITATATSPGAITNVAVKTGQNEPDPNTNNDSGGTITSTAPAADVLVVKNVDRSDVLVGETVTFTVRAINRGPSPATGVVITDALPAGLTLITPTPSQGTYADGVWTVGSLAAPAVATLTLVARVDATGALVNNAAVTAQDRGRPGSAQQQRRRLGERGGGGRSARDEGGERPGAGGRRTRDLHDRGHQPRAERGDERDDQRRAARERRLRLGHGRRRARTTRPAASGRSAACRRP